MRESGAVIMAKEEKMVDASVLLHMISALETLETGIPGGGCGRICGKKQEREAPNKACRAEYRVRERTLDAGLGYWSLAS
jgi:hypothetical protein